MEEEDCTSGGYQATHWTYVTFSSDSISIRYYSDGLIEANRVNSNPAVITDPSDSRFDLEAYLKAAEAAE